MGAWLLVEGGRVVAWDGRSLTDGSGAVTVSTTRGPGIVAGMGGVVLPTHLISRHLPCCPFWNSGCLKISEFIVCFSCTRAKPHRVSLRTNDDMFRILKYLGMSSFVKRLGSRIVNAFPSGIHVTTSENCSSSRMAINCSVKDSFLSDSVSSILPVTETTLFGEEEPEAADSDSLDTEGVLGRSCVEESQRLLPELTSGKSFDLATTVAFSSKSDAAASTRAMNGAFVVFPGAS